MSATDELRRLLDERGIEHEDFDDGLVYNHTTSWSRDRYKACYSEYRSGVVRMEATCISPEQAIEATVGNHAKRIIVANGATGHCNCSSCGELIGTWDNYCKHCGAKLEVEL